MTKKEVHKRFYNTLTLEEKEDCNNLPDFVVHICKVQPPLSEIHMSWARAAVICLT